MKSLSIIALVLFVSSQSFANDAKVATPAPDQAAVSAKTEAPAAEAKMEAPTKVAKKKAKHSKKN